MSVVEKTISKLISKQLPEFVRTNHPKFQRFLELYYEWLEDSARGNTVFHLMNIDSYKDIDETIDPFVTMFKNELLPYFPDTTRLDIAKILKGAREFYNKKGTESSVKWLFSVIFGDDIEIHVPKKQLLIASNGKWKLPRAFRLTLSTENENFDISLLVRGRGTGVTSKATCVIESANRMIDPNTGYEVIELFVTNLKGEFENGEDISISYTDENDVDGEFVETLIGSISRILIDPNKRGRSYKPGDPVVIYGGLGTSDQAAEAVAEVEEVTTSSIEQITVEFAGYGYTSYYDTECRALTVEGGTEINNTEVRVLATETTSSSESQLNFLEYITVDKMPIEFMSTVQLDSSDFLVLTGNNRNINIQATEIHTGNDYATLEYVYADGTSYSDATFKARIFTSNTISLFGGGSPATDNVILFSVTNTSPISSYVGETLIGANTGKRFTIDVINDDQVQANVDSAIIQTLNFETIPTGGISTFQIVRPGSGIIDPPFIEATSYFETYWTEEAEAYPSTEYKQTRLPMSSFGQIAHVYIEDGGDGYANGDAIVIGDRGYGFTGFVNVGVGGVISNTTITSRGEGYYGDKTVTITTSGGANAVLRAYGFGEGLDANTYVGVPGKIRTIKLTYNGYDYETTPNVSLRVGEIVITGIEDQTISPDDIMYVGADLDSATFYSIIKDYNPTTGQIRFYNYSGNTAQLNTEIIKTSTGLEFIRDGSSTPFLGTTDLLANPYFYGDGKARANAEFLNGLINYNGFFLNTDGFPSSDKKLQGPKVYHNYSYIIESERSLLEYKNVVKDIVHPAGMSMLSRTLVNSRFEDPLKNSSNVCVIPARNKNDAGDNVTVIIEDSYSNIVTSNGISEFVGVLGVNVGDLFVLQSNSSSPMRSQTKIIDSVSDEELGVQGNFNYMGQGVVSSTVQKTPLTGTVQYATGSNNFNGTGTLFLTELAVDDCILVNNQVNFIDTITDNLTATTRYRFLSAGSGNTVNVVSNTTFTVSGNTNAISHFVSVGDTIRINVAQQNVYMAQTGTVSITSNSANVVGSAFLAKGIEANDFILLNNEVKEVVNVVNGSLLIVNSPYTATSSGNKYLILVKKAEAPVTSISGNTVTVATAITQNTENLAYMVVPDYSTVGYPYKIVKITSE